MIEVEKVLVERYVTRCPACGRIINETTDLKQAERLQRLLDNPAKNRCTGSNPEPETRTLSQDPKQAGSTADVGR